MISLVGPASATEFPLPLPTAELQERLAALYDAGRLSELFDPHSHLNAIASDFPSPVSTDWPAPRLQCIYWPVVGFARYAYACLLVDEYTVGQIRAQMASAVSNTVQILLRDDPTDGAETARTVSMQFLATRPLVRTGTDPLTTVDNSTDPVDAWVMLLVDDRYRTLQQSLTSITVTAWSDVFSSFGIGITDTVDGDYLTPGARWTTDRVGGRSLGWLADVAALAVGSRIVNVPGASPTLQRPTNTNRTVLSAAHTAAGSRFVGGGAVGTDDYGPGRPNDVRVWFGGPTETTPVSVTATVQTAYAWPSTAYLSHWCDAPASTSSGNRSALTAQWEQDWSDWQTGLYDTTYSGFIAAPATGFLWAVVWCHDDKTGYTKFVRPPHWYGYLLSPTAGKSASGTGTVTGSGTDNHVTRWDGTGTTAIQDSLAVLDDTGNLTTPGTIQSFRNGGAYNGTATLDGESGAPGLAFVYTAGTVPASTNVSATNEVGGNYYFAGLIADVSTSSPTLDVGTDNTLIHVGTDYGGTVRFHTGAIKVSQTAGTDATCASGTDGLGNVFLKGLCTTVGSGSPGSGNALTSNPLSQFASTTSAQLAGVISDETGSGQLVFATSPTLVTPVLGVATATSVNGTTITTSTGTLTLSTFTLTAAANATVSGTNTGDQTTVSGNAGTATALQTARTINGTSFDGTANITVTAAAGTLTGATLNSGVTASSLTSLGTQAATLNMGTHTITNVVDPSNPQDAATKAYVDALSQGITSKHVATVATAAVLSAYTYLTGVITFTATGTNTVDGVVTALNDYVLVKNETGGNAPYNGLYKVTVAGAVGVAGVWTRSVDMDAGSEFPGANVFVEQGTANSATSWVCTNSTAPTVGTTAITFVQFSGAGTYTAGTGLTLTGSVFSLTSPVTVTLGGTGAATLTNHGVLLGQGTSAVAATAAMTDGQILVGQTGADPLPKTVSGDGTLAASGAITITKSSGVSFGTAAFVATGTSGTTVPFLDGGNTWSGEQDILISDAGTTNFPTALVLGHNSSAAAADGFGVVYGEVLKDSTTSSTLASATTTSWATAAHATRKARKQFYIYDTAARECLRVEASGSAAMIGVLGASASARLASPDAGTALVTFGFASGTPTFAAANLTGTTLASSVVTSSLTSVGTLTGGATGAGFTIALTTSTVTGTLPTAAFPALTGAVTTTAGSVATILSAGYTRGYIDGFILTFNSTTLWNIGAGCCRDDTDAYTITLAATTKKMQAAGAWTAGSGNNGLDTGAIAASTWYHVWAICKADGTLSDTLFSLSATAPTMPTGYTLKRLIGSFKSNASSQVWDQFVQDGDTFILKTPILTINTTNPGTTAVTRTLDTPTGVRCQSIIAVSGNGTTSTADPGNVYISDLSVVDSAPGGLVWTVATTNGSAVNNTGGAQAYVFTNTSAQVRSRIATSAAGTTLSIATVGWVHPRGRNQ